ncbi:MAG: ribosomal protein S12 methylthiotransferase accessory factor [Phenylobacterium sp.]|jgi:ribosomal protein S12 methylthiotransferase accessory factor
MTKKLGLSPAATITPNPDGVLLQSDLGDFQLHGQDVGQFIHHICPLLQGQHSESDICLALPEYDDASIKSILNLLQQKGLVEALEPNRQFAPPWPTHDRFLQAFGGEQKYSTQTLRDCHLLVIGLEPWSVKMIDELAHAGIGHIHIIDHEKLNHSDVLCHRPLQQHNIGQLRAQVLKTVLSEQAPWCEISHEPLQLDAQQQLQLNHPQAWDLVVVGLCKEAQYWLHKCADYIHQHQYLALYGAVDGLESRTGPVVSPGQSACWNCLRLRVLAGADNPQLAHQLDHQSREGQQTSRDRTLLSPMAVMCGQSLAMEALKLLLKYSPSNLVGKVQVHNLITNRADIHRIVPMPWCDVCGFDHQAVSQHLFSASDKSLDNINSVEQLKALLAGWIDPLTGIIGKLSGHSPDLPSFPMTACAQIANFTTGQFNPRVLGRSGSGKGLDEVSAHIGAVGEAIERYSAARYRLDDCHYGAIDQLKGDYIDPQVLVLYSPQQYSDKQFPFSRWHTQKNIHWVQGRKLAQETPVWVPALVSYFNFNAPFEEQFCQTSSSGLAAGKNWHDAAIRATFELIERDAMMLTWYAQLPCQRLTIERFKTGKMAVMINQLYDNDVALELYVLDVGLHIPTVVCLALGDGHNTPAVSVSLAAHDDINVAISKALLEQGHLLPHLKMLMASDYLIPSTIEQVLSLEDHAAYYFSQDKLSAFDFMRQSGQDAIKPDQWPYPSISDTPQKRQQIAQRLATAKVDIVIADVTSPDIALSPFTVVRALGAHMQPIHFGEQYKRVDNPRLDKLLEGRPVNLNPHPVA